MKVTIFQTFQYADRSADQYTNIGYDIIASSSSVIRGLLTIRL